MNEKRRRANALMAKYYSGMIDEGAWRHASGDIAVFNTKYRRDLKSLVVQLEPIQAGSGEPSPDNVRPISGRTGATVWRTGKNLLPKAQASATMNGITWTVNADGSITAIGTSTGRSYIRIIINSRDQMKLPVGTYTYSLHPIGNDYVNLYSLIGAYKGNTYYRNVVTLRNDNSYEGAFFWTENDIDAVFDIAVEVRSSGRTINCTFYPQIELGTTATDYDPYTGTFIPVSWETEAGTVYGGTIDVVSGVLTVSHFLYVYDGTEAFTKSSTATNGFYNQLVSEYPPHNWPYMANYNEVRVLTTEMSSLFKMTRNVALYRNTFWYCYLDTGMNFSVDPDVFGQTVEDFKSKLADLYAADTPVTVYAKLAQPQTYQLAPQQIQTLVGENVIRSDAGPVSVEYWS